VQQALPLGRDNRFESQCTHFMRPRSSLRMVAVSRSTS